MSNQTSHPKITGSAYSIKGSIILVAALAFIISFMLMGTAFIHFFVVLFIGLTTLNLVAFTSVRWTNWFEFDDEKKLILRVFRQRIPYDKIQAIVISEVWNGFTVNIKTGRLQVYPVASGLNKVDAELAEKEFAKRFSFEIIHKESHRKRLAIISAIALLILVMAFANFYYRMSRLEPSEVVTAEKRDWMTSVKPTEGRQYQINGVDFILPDRFSQSKKENGWLYFEDNLNKTKVKVGPGLLQDSGFKRGSIFAYVTGIQDDYDFFRLGYTARFGLIPALINLWPSQISSI